MSHLSGRSAEQSVLREALAKAVRGAGAVQLITGEAGIGKTRLAAELAAEAQAAGAQAVCGRAWECGGAPPYWPWIEALREMQDAPGAAAALALFQDGNPLAETTARLRRDWYDKVVNALRTASRDQPRLLLLDDLHAADEPSVLLLQFVAEHVADLPLLVLAVFRSGSGADSVRAQLEQLSVQHPVVHLGPLNARAVETIAQATKPDLADSERHALYVKSGGNPLFVHALLRCQGALEDVPDEVRDVIREQLAPLPDATRALLDGAAVLGNEFEAATVATLQTAGAPITTAAAAAQAFSVAVHLGILRETRAGRFAFAHGLVRQLIYETIPARRREQLHVSAGERLERGGGGDALFEIAFHYAQAAALDRGLRALPWLRRAALQAMAGLAFEEAERLLLLGLTFVDDQTVSPQERCALLHALGDARWKAGRYESARESFLQVVHVARATELWEPMARALIAMSDESVTISRVDWPLVHLLEECLRLAPPQGSPLHAALLACLAYALYSAPEQEARRLALSRQAVEMARGCGDPVLLGHTLERYCWALWGPQNTEERLQAALELGRVALDSAEPGLLIASRMLTFVARYELGDSDGGDRDLLALDDLVHRSGAADSLGIVATLKAMRALLRGELALGEEQMMAALQTARPNDRNQAQNYAAQLWLLRELQGRLAELEPLVRGFMGEYPEVATWRTALAVLCCEQDRPEEARWELAELAKMGFANLPKDVLWLTTIMGLARVSAYLRDRHAASQLYELLLPYGGRNIVLSGGVASYGAASLYLAVLAATMEAWDTATRHFEESIRLNRHMQAWPALAMTLCEYASVLQTADGALSAPSHRQPEPLLAEASEIAARLGLAAIATRVAALRAALAARDSSAIAASAVIDPEGTDRPVIGLRRDGEEWTLRRAATAHRLRSAKGLEYLSYLLQHPHVDVPVVDLIGSLDRDPAGLAASMRQRASLHDLRQELAAAEAAQDLGRVDLLRRRLEATTQSTLHTLGLSANTVDAQYARVNVRRAVTRAIREISRVDGQLGRHLSASIRTGRLCSYVPDPQAPLQWDILK